MARTVSEDEQVDRWEPLYEGARRLVIALFVVVNILNLVAIVDGRFDHEGIRWVLLDSEGNPSTWFASALWLVAAMAAAVVSVLEPAHGRFWRLLAWTLGALSIEEVAQLHERISGNLSSAMEDGGPVTAAWVVPGLVLVIGWVVVMARVVPRDAPRIVVPLVIGGVLYVVGALGLEALVGELFTGNEVDHRPAQLFATVEENLEMIASMLVAHTIVEHARALFRAESPR